MAHQCAILNCIARLDMQYAVITKTKYCAFLVLDQIFPQLKLENIREYSPNFKTARIAKKI